jgi:hypothetical protein
MYSRHFEVTWTMRASRFIQRVAVVLKGDLLSIEYGDGGESQSVEITPGQVEREEPSARVHRAVNVGTQPSEQVAEFSVGAKRR